MSGRNHAHPTKPSAPSFTMGGRDQPTTDKSLLANPGPGQYTHGSQLSNQTSKFGNEQRRSNSTTVAPGPGQYNIKPKAVEGPGYSMRQKTHERSQSMASPGPGNYNAKVAEKHETQVYSLGARREHKKETNVAVGPGAYDFERKATQQKSPTFKFGSEQRTKDTSPARDVPGPGQYQYDSRIQEGPQYGFGSTSKDTKLKVVNANLGPASYTLPTWTQTDNKGQSMTPRRPWVADNQKSFVPGPGQYNSPILERKQPTWKLGSDVRKSLETKSNNAPGPGNYSIPENKGTSIGFGTAKRQGSGTNLALQTPGPGSYQTPSRAREGPCFSMRQKTQLQNKQHINPGPGNYNHVNENSILKKAPNFGMGTSSRTDAKVSGVPGPGQYNMRLNPAEGPNYGFGTESKDSKRKVEDPGYTYDLPGTFPKLPKNKPGGITSPSANNSPKR